MASILDTLKSAKKLATDPNALDDAQRQAAGMTKAEWTSYMKRKAAADDAQSERDASAGKTPALSILFGKK